MKILYPFFLVAVLMVAAIAPPAQAMTACQDLCNTQYYATVDALWQAQRPATTAPTTYRQQVMAALTTLNQCMDACSASTTAPTPTAPAPPTPFQSKGKK